MPKNFIVAILFRNTLSRKIIHSQFPINLIAIKQMKKLFSNNEVAEIIKIPIFYMDELFVAARLVYCVFDYYALCHHSLSILGNKFGLYNGTEIYDIGKLLDEKQWTGFKAKFAPQTFCLEMG
jgi:hypothetical protein